MRLCYFLSSVNSFFKRACTAIHWGYMSDFWLVLRLLSYFMRANGEVSGETARMHRLASAFAGRLCDKYLNLMSWLIYFTIPQKAPRTYRRVLEGAEVGFLWSYVMEETVVHGGNQWPWTGNHYPITCQRRESNPGCSGDKQGFYLCANQTISWFFFISVNTGI